MSKTSKKSKQAATPELPKQSNPGNLPAKAEPKALAEQSVFPILQLDGKDAEDMKALPPEQVANTQLIIKAAQAVITSHGELAMKYRELVSTIRTTNYSILHCRCVLKGLGFNKVRISEIQRVAYCSDEIYSAYISGNIGLKGALELVRGGVTTPAAVALLPEVAKAGEKASDIVEHYGKQTEVGKLMSSELDEAAATPAAKKRAVQWKAKAEKLANAMLKIAALGKLPKGGAWSVPGWTVMLEPNDIEAEDEGEE